MIKKFILVALSGFALSNLGAETLTTNTVWSAGTLHVVREQMVIPSGISLTIEPGAIVKFQKASGITVQSGGTLKAVGTKASPIILTSLADDEIEGDTDGISDTPAFGDWTITVESGGTHDDLYCRMRYGRASDFGTASLPAHVVVSENDGVVRIPTTATGDRTRRFTTTWKAKDGSALFGNDFTEASGVVTWSGVGDGMRYLEIPIVKDDVREGVERFVVEFTESQGINLSSSASSVEVVICGDSIVDMPICAESISSPRARFDLRASGTTVGASLVTGVECRGEADGSSVTEWDTTKETNGWKSFTSGTNKTSLIVVNDAAIAIEGGRLSESVEWGSNVTHIVRNWVIVPNGVTLSVTTNAVVKFCENTGIKVESGGSVRLCGSGDAPVYLTHIADDTIGGDSDSREGTITDKAYGFTIVNGGSFSDSDAVIRCALAATQGTASVPSSVEVNERFDKAEIPVSVSGSRTTPFRIDWRVIPGTATYPADYTVASGTLEWTKASEGIKNIVIPVVKDDDTEEPENFVVELVESRGINLSRTAYRTEVFLYDVEDVILREPVCAASVDSDTIRIESRARGETVGGSLVNGVELRGEPDGASFVLWDTTAETNGWQTLTRGTNATDVLVLNDAGVSMEGGRLGENTVWDSNTVHVVKNWVVVPSGITLTVTTNAVVKFSEHTGIKVESGGKLNVVGTETNAVFFTSVHDDTVGGDVDYGDIAPTNGHYSITVVSGGTFMDSYSSFRYVTLSSHGTVSVPSSVVVSEDAGMVRIPVSVSGSRTTPFSVAWRAVAGTAKLGDDYTLASGRVRWSSASEGMKWIEIPLVCDQDFEGKESFVIELFETQGINLSSSSFRTEVTVYDEPVKPGVSAQSVASAMISLDTRDIEDGFGYALNHGTVTIGSHDGELYEEWDTTAETNGWHTLTSGTNETAVLVLNDVVIDIEGGRISENTVWSNDVVHLLKNWVVIPSGKTLTVTTNTVVKFCRHTGFKVESGGRLCVVGSEDQPVVFTTATDDTIGGDCDMREVTPEYGDWTTTIVSGGAYSDTHCAVRYATLANLGDASLPSAIVVGEREGTVRIPVSVTGGRTTAFYVDWRVNAGTATLSNDYTIASGRIKWNAASDGIKWIEIPLVVDSVPEDMETFTVELFESQGINCDVDRRFATVSVYDSEIPAVASAESVSSEITRIENRVKGESAGYALNTGTEFIGEPEGETVKEWHTAELSDGWHSVTSGTNRIELLTLNEDGLVVEGGRLAANTVWSNDVVHVVRNWIVVPSGTTLTVLAGSIVKFCDNTGIKVESGGKLVVSGTEKNEVVFTTIHDDAVGGDTDARNVSPEFGDYSIVVVSGGTFSDTNLALRYGTSGNFGTVSIAAQVVAAKDSEVVRIPVSVSSSRTTPFAVDWTATDGTAVYGEDYGVRAGRMNWTKASEGTKFIEIPLPKDSHSQVIESFTVTLSVGRGINLNLSQRVCVVSLYNSVEASFGEGDEQGSAASEWSTTFALDTRAGIDPILSLGGDETITYSPLWSNSTNEQDLAATVYLKNAEGEVSTFASSAYPDEGEKTWRTDDLACGRYAFSHEIRDASNKLLDREAIDFVRTDAVLHGGYIAETNEVWKADKIHIVYMDVIVPADWTLTIEDGAIVKFMTGTRILVETGGAGYVTGGAILTHVNDDSAGGDSLYDGNTASVMNSYELDGAWTIDGDAELRHMEQEPLSGTISTSQTLRANAVYEVTGNLTIASGATLTIPAGVVLKFASGKSLIVKSGATLNANGTRSAPVVFTSIKDDEYGGDTNEDGDATVAQAGDWDEILNSGGTINFEYVVARYAGYGEFSNQGDAIVRTSSGKTILNGCVVESSPLRLIGRTGGTVVATNCVVRDGRWGLDGSITFVNGIIYDCSTGVNGAYVVNSVFANCSASGASSSRVHHCLFFESGEAVGNGSFVGDPKFIDPDNGDFRTQMGSACIDAADGSVAPETDYYGQPRQDIRDVEKKGTPAVNDTYPDIGIYEMMPRVVKSDIDLEVVSFAISTNSATVGERIQVSWTVKNIGSASVVDTWHDTFEFVDSHGRVTELGCVAVSGGITAGGTRVLSATLRIPPIMDGKVYLRVSVNKLRDIFEGSQTANNTMVLNDAFDVSVLSLDANTIPKVYVESNGKQSLKIDKNSGIKSIRIRNAAGLTVYGAVGYVPNVNAQYQGVVLNDGSVLLTVPTLAEGEVFYVVFDNTSSENEREFVVTPDTSCLRIDRVNETKFANEGVCTIILTGTGLDSECKVFLDGNQKLTASSVVVLSESDIACSFDVADKSAGLYDLLVESSSGKKIELSGVIELYAPRRGAKLEAELIIPSTVREGRKYVGILRYSNTGDTDMLAPYFEIVSNDAEMFLNDGSEIGRNTLRVLGVASTYPCGILKAGTSNEITFEFISGSAPTFRLETEDDKSGEWATISQRISNAATIVNQRGRMVVSVEDLYEYAENFATNPASFAACGRLNVVNGIIPENTTIVAETNEGEFISSGLVERNGMFIIDGLYASSNYVLRVMGDLEAEKKKVTIPNTGDLLGIIITAISQRCVNISFTGLPEDEVLSGTIILYDGEGNLLSDSRFSDAISLNYMSTNMYDSLFIEAELDSGWKVHTCDVVSPYDSDVGTEIEIDFSEATLLSGTVFDNSGNIITSGLIQVRSTDCSVLKTAIVNTNGVYVVGGLDVGEYMAYVMTEEGESDAVAILVNEGEIVNVDFTITPAITFDVTTTVSGVSSNDVLVVENTASEKTYSYTVENGTQILSGIREGVYNFYILDSDGCLISEVKQLNVGTSDNEISISVLRYIEVSGVIQNESGEGVFGFVRIDPGIGSRYYFMSDTNGLFSAKVPVGRYWLESGAIGCSEKACSVDLSKACSLTLTLPSFEDIEVEDDDEQTEYQEDSYMIGGTFNAIKNLNIDFIEKKQNIACATLPMPSGAYSITNVPSSYDSVWITDSQGTGLLVERSDFEASLHEIDILNGDLRECNISVFADNAKTIPLTGVEVVVTGVCSNTITQVTDSFGVAKFNLSEGVYNICVQRENVGVGTTLMVDLKNDHNMNYVFEGALEIHAEWLEKQQENIILSMALARNQLSPNTTFNSLYKMPPNSMFDWMVNTFMMKDDAVYKLWVEAKKYGSSRESMGKGWYRQVA